MLRELWDRLVGRERASAREREAEREQMSPSERRVTGQSVEDTKADEFVDEHLGGIKPERLLGEDDPQRD